MNYYRITAYDNEHDLTCILDSKGAYEKLWQFSSYVLSCGFEILEVGGTDKYMDVNVGTSRESDKIALRAYAKGKPLYTTANINGANYKAVVVGEKTYVPDKQIRV